jgi:hypothetical protein
MTDRRADSDPLGDAVRDVLDKLTERGAEYITRTMKDALSRGLQLHDAVRGSADPADPLPWQFRNGRKVIFNLYRQVGPEPSDRDRSIGYARTEHAARELVTYANLGLRRATGGADEDRVRRLENLASAVKVFLDHHHKVGTQRLRIQVLEQLYGAYDDLVIDESAPDQRHSR